MGRPLRPGPGCGRARRPRRVGVSGAADRTSPLLCGPSALGGPVVGAPRRASRGRGRTPCPPRIPAGDDTLARSARAGALLPFPRHPASPVCSDAHRQAGPCCPAPRARSVGWGLASARAGRCLRHKRALSALPVRVLNPLAFSWQVFGSHAPGGQQQPKLPSAFRGACWPLAHPPGSPGSCGLGQTQYLHLGRPWGPLAARSHCRQAERGRLYGAESPCTWPGASLMLGNFRTTTKKNRNLPHSSEKVAHGPTGWTGH